MSRAYVGLPRLVIAIHDDVLVTDMPLRGSKVWFTLSKDDRLLVAIRECCGCVAVIDDIAKVHGTSFVFNKGRLSCRLQPGMYLANISVDALSQVYSRGEYNKYVIKAMKRYGITDYVLPEQASPE